MNLTQRKQHEKERFEKRKANPYKPFRLIIVERKFPSKLHKKMEKLEKLYDRYAKCPLRLARILKQAEALDKRIQKNERRILANGTQPK